MLRCKQLTHTRGLQDRKRVCASSRIVSFSLRYGARAAVVCQASAVEPEEVKEDAKSLSDDSSAPNTAAIAAARKGTAKLLAENLGSLSFVIIGEDTDLNLAVATALAKTLGGWFPVSTSKVLAGMFKAETVEKLVEEQGKEKIIAAEADMVKKMRTQMRVVIGTLGFGAATLSETYRHLNTALVVLVEEDGASGSAAVRSTLLRHAEVCVRLKKQRGFAVQSWTTQDKAAAAVKLLVSQLWQYLGQHPSLVADKRKAVEDACGVPPPRAELSAPHPVAAALPRTPTVVAPM